jgi:hypothetical protein
LPITEHSTSRPAAAASTIARGSWASAESSAADSWSGVETLAIPTDEPSEPGLTNTGRPSPASSSSTRWGSARHRASVTAP